MAKKEQKTLAWVSENEGILHYTAIPDLKEELSGVRMDMFPSENMESFFGVNETDEGQASLYILKTVANTVDKMSFEPTPLENGSKGHPFLALEQKIKEMGFKEEALERWLTSLKKIRVVGSSFEWDKLMSDKLGALCERHTLERALIQMN